MTFWESREGILIPRACRIAWSCTAIDQSNCVFHCSYYIKKDTIQLSHCPLPLLCNSLITACMCNFLLMSIYCVFMSVPDFRMLMSIEHWARPYIFVPKSCNILWAFLWAYCMIFVHICGYKGYRISSCSWELRRTQLNLIESKAFLRAPMAATLWLMSNHPVNIPCGPHTGVPEEKLGRDSFHICVMSSQRELKSGSQSVNEATSIGIYRVSQKP
jgi:hypothetical protein